ncbi:uncharacterized protein [Primulina huaijiensis]|uniref:uncharacterized protein n=1 Tax=Primulina huaijiensis TaxID=1492673 RepID=UPI003CC72F58
MNPDEISRLVDKIKLSNHDDQKVILLEEDWKLGRDRMANCLAAQVISVKNVNREAFRSQITRIMQLKGKVVIESVGNNTFIMDFAHKVDRNMALCEGPWNFFQDLIVLKDVQGLVHPHSIKFDEISIWAQCHNVPLAFLNKNTLAKIGSHIGVVEEVDEGLNGSCLGQFSRIRVRINITKPLKKFIRVSTGMDHDDNIIIVSYERLPDFCYRCGIIGHSFRTCEASMGENISMEYGSWMRATSKMRGRASPNKLAVLLLTHRTMISIMPTTQKSRQNPLNRSQ